MPRKKRTYLGEVEWLMKSLYTIQSHPEGKVAGETAVLRDAEKKGMPTIVLSQLRLYLDNPSEQAKLHEQYRKLRSRQFERSEAQTKREKPLSEEKGYIACVQFLERWASADLGSKVPHGGVIPGYEGMGQEAVRQVLEKLEAIARGEGSMQDQEIVEAPADRQG